MTNPNILRTPIVRKILDLNGNAITGATANIFTIPGSATTTVYSTETGAGTISQPLISDVDGGLSGWLEIGIYDIKVETSLGTSTSRYYVNHPQQSLLQGDSLEDNNLQIKDDNDTTARFTVNAGGTISLGSGSGTADVTLYRSGAGTLTTNGAFVVGTNLNIQGDDLALAIKLNKEVFG